MDFVGPAVIIVAGLIGLAFIMLIWAASRYKRCPSDRILVVYGKTGQGQASRCIHGGAAFVWPVIQDFAFLDLTPISIDVDLRGALSKQNIRVNVPSQFTVGVSTQPGVMENAADRLLALDRNGVRQLSENIIVGQLRLVVATMDIEEINTDRDKFLTNVASNVGQELTKIGLNLINVNVTDIKDESGYIEALGKEAAAKAINDARKSVAEKNRDGSIGAAEAEKDQRIKVATANAQAEAGVADAERIKKVKIATADAQAEAGVADAHRIKRIQISEANAKAVEGENLAKITVADSDAERREKEATFLRKATAAEKVQSAKTLEEAYIAEQTAEKARAAKELATREADEIVRAEIEKRKIEIAAEGEAEQIRRLAKGEADAIFLKKEAEARGLLELLSKQAEGFERLAKSAGDNPRDAVLMMIADKLPELVKTQVDAIKNIKIDKVTVWEGGNSEGEGNSTSKFVSGLYKSVPPLNDLFNMAGMELPDYLGKQGEKEQEKEPEIIEVSTKKKKK